MRDRTTALALLITATLGMTVFLAAPAFASGDTSGLNENDQVVLNGRLDVAEGETLDTAVLFHGSATIAGTATGDVVVFDGTTDISGHVRGDVFVFNGDTNVRSGAQIDGDLVTGQTPVVESGATVQGQQQRISSRFNAGVIGAASRFAWWVGYSVSTLVLGLLLFIFVPALDPAVIRAVRGRMGASIGFGVLVFFVLPIVAALFLVVVIAIPLGLFTLLALALLYTVGYVVGAHAIGRLIVKPPTSRFLAFIAGWGILRLLGLIPVVGGLVWTLASIFGLGVLWVTARGTEPKQLPAQTVPPTPTVMG